MKTKPDVSWVKNLWEVGSPIRGAAQSIQLQIADADKALETAKARHTESMANIANQAAAVEREVSSLWTPAEIDAAKRGLMLVDGREIQVN